jgi:hypothetical protein
MTDKPDSDDGLSETTRDLRRALYLSETLELVVEELEIAMAQASAHQQMRAVLHRHLEGAWNDGARKEADLRSSVQILKAQVESLRGQLRDALKRISDSRVEPDS